MSENKKGISLIELVMLIISSAIGAGIFNATQQLAAVATPGPALVAWGITGIGIFCLALSLKSLSQLYPELDGVSDYARAGFGNFAGFISGWGYWLSAWLGNIAFATMMMSAIGYFIPSFKSGNSIPAVILASIISWLLTLFVINGVESAAFVNTIITIIKLVPIAAFIILGIIMFKTEVFTAHFWQNFSNNFTYYKATPIGVFSQIKGCIITMMWIFVGIEGATMMAERAKKKSDASKATIIGFLSLLVIYVVVSMLPYGYLTQSQLAHLNDPALTYVLEAMVGKIGGMLVSITIIISILGAWLSWIMLPVECTTHMAEQGLLPKWFGKLNKKGSPVNSLLLTAGLVQIVLISLIFTEKAYDVAISLCTAAIVVCYALVGAYAIKVGLKKSSYKMIFLGAIAVIFEVVGIAFSGLQFLWLCSIAYLLGFAFYIKSCRDNNYKINTWEWILIAIITILAISAIIALSLGKVSVN